MVAAAKWEQSGKPAYADLAADYVEFAKGQVRDSQLKHETLKDCAWFLDDFIEC